MRFKKPAASPSTAEGLTPSASGAGWSATLIVGVALTLVVIVLAVQNTERTHLEFLGWDTSTPLVVILLVAVLVGVVFDEFAGLLWRHRRRRQLAEREELAARRAASGFGSAVKVAADVTGADTTEAKEVPA